MLEDRIIKLVEESEWISPMVVHDKTRRDQDMHRIEKFE
jgi:hypothetical protein